MPPPATREVWQNWLRRHSVDPSDVAVPGWIERDERNYRVCYEAYARNGEGAIQPNADRTEALREPHYVQLKGPPLPFPAAGEVHDAEAPR